MKKIISILAFTSLLCCSCDYLDVVPEGKATEEDIWKTTEQADKFRYYLQTYMPNLIGYDWSPDQFAGDDFITGARGTTYYFSSKSLLYNEETSSNTYFGRWEPSSVSGGTNYDIYRGIRYCYYMLDNVYKVPVISPENADLRRLREVHRRLLRQGGRTAARDGRAGRTGYADEDGGAQLQGAPAALRRLAAGQRQSRLRGIQQSRRYAADEHHLRQGEMEAGDGCRRGGDPALGEVRPKRRQAELLPLHEYRFDAR